MGLGGLRHNGGWGVDLAACTESRRAPGQRCDRNFKGSGCGLCRAESSPQGGGSDLARAPLEHVDYHPRRPFSTASGLDAARR
jgi:hypothetical protein